MTCVSLIRAAVRESGSDEAVASRQLLVRRLHRHDGRARTHGHARAGTEDTKMSSSVTFLVVSFIVGAIVVAMIGASAVHYALVVIGILVVLTIIQVLIGFN